MDLSPKATRFILEALDQYEKYFDERLGNGSLSEDELSDLGNDRQYLDAIRQDLQNYQREQTRQREELNAAGRIAG